LALLAAVAFACASRKGPPPLPPLARAADAAMILVPPGPFLAGSTQTEREQAYLDADRTSGHDWARRGLWFDNEEPRHEVELPAFWLDRTHVTNAAYAEMVRALEIDGPSIDEETWRRQNLVQRWGSEVRRYNWQGATPPAGRDQHPVVLVTWFEADRYCRFRRARLPSAAELEKAARGTDGLVYPWGEAWDPSRLDSDDQGPHDTLPVGSFPTGAGPFGHLDLAGLVFSWTSTPWPVRGHKTVKGSAWDDHAGVGRGASHHGRPATLRHAIIGFRCARDA